MLIYDVCYKHAMTSKYSLSYTMVTYLRISIAKSLFLCWLLCVVIKRRIPVGLCIRSIAVST